MHQKGFNKKSAFSFYDTKLSPIFILHAFNSMVEHHRKASRIVAVGPDPPERCLKPLKRPVVYRKSKIADRCAIGQISVPNTFC